MLNKDIISVYNGLQLAKENAEICFPARTTFAIVRNLKLIEPIAEALMTAKNQVLKELGNEDKNNPGSYFIPLENRDELVRQMDTLDNIDNEIDFYKIKWVDIEKLDLPIQIMEGLYPMLEEEN